MRHLRICEINKPMFTEQEKQILKKYVTSTEADIFAIKGMEGMVGAAYARYSRA